MKRLLSGILIVLMMFIINGEVSAQRLTAKGIMGGFNLSDVDGSDVYSDTKRLEGFNVGAFATFRYNRQFAIQPELLFTTKGFTTEEKPDGVTMTYSMKLKYLDLPVLAVVTLNPKFKLYGGPYISLFLNGENSTKFTAILDGKDYKDINTDIKSDEINSPEFGFVLGAAMALGQGSLGVRYSQGVTNLKSSKEDAQNNVIQMIIALAL